jgi:hypothetical protein
MRHPPPKPDREFCIQPAVDAEEHFSGARLFQPQQIEITEIKREC